MAGTTPDIVWLADGAFSAPEPMWLALWGLALIGFSNTLRSRGREQDQPAPREAGHGALDSMRASVAQPISSRA